MSLRELARAAGLDPDYSGWNGAPTKASDEAVRAVLVALGVDPHGTVASLEAVRWQTLVPPFVVGWDGVLELPFAVIADRDGAWEATVTTESGRTVTATGTLFALPADSHAHPGGIVHCIRRARIELGGELGYHRLAWRCLGQEGEAHAISAPRRAWGGPGQGKRRWGVFAPVYGLASPASGQAGDLASLARLFDAVERRGGTYVATLPILAQFLDEPCHFSPYSPASRLFWNEMYLDLGELAAEVGMAAPVAPPNPVAEPLIDYQTQYHWRRHALDPIAERVLATPALSREVTAWATTNAAYDYAAFRAFGEHHRAGWSAWPAALRDAPPPIPTREAAIALGADVRALDTHLVGQWAMQRQLDAFAKRAAHLYLDLPVGVNCDAYEVWRHRHLFLTTLAAGAPPDALFLGGQNWGLPPLSPAALRADGYRYFIACVRHHMSVAGMLRVDHVMGLFRLYCVPAGHAATDGVYLRYEAEELLAILALESQRAKCALVGEDLGTVPDGVRPAMTRHGLFRLHVGQWFLPAKVGDKTGVSPAESVASLNTHDTATFAGWWHGADLDDQVGLGLITPKQEQHERTVRAKARAAVLATAPAFPALDDEARAMVGATAELALGPAEVVLVALDDLALDPVPHNVPGTTTQRPNWQRRVAGWDTALDEQAASPAAAATLAAVCAARP